MTIKKWVGALCAMLLLAALATPVLADDWYEGEMGCYTVETDDGQPLFSFAGQISVDDEYISGDNRVYRVVEVDDNARTAVARYVEDWSLEGLADEVMNVSAAASGQKRIGLYCTHTDESYIKGDGTEAKPESGGIVDVAKTLADRLKEDGVEAVVDDTSHDPHDAGAYRRSRSSAVGLMESEQPDMLLDIHRDGIPDATEYDRDVGGERVSGVRMVLGRGNQNIEANKDMVKKIKAIADKKFPGLIKDVYVGKGSYNQDLTPNSMLLEFGTHTIEKDKVLESTKYVADVLAEYLGASGGTTQGTAAPGQSAAPQAQATAGGAQQQSAKQQNNSSANKASGKSIAWTVGILALAGLVFLVVAVQKGGRKARAGNFFQELTGTGKRDDEHDEK